MTHVQTYTKQSVHAEHVARRTRMARPREPRCPPKPRAETPDALGVDLRVQHNDHVVRYWRHWRPKHADVSVHAIVSACARRYDVGIDDMHSSDRGAKVSHARHVAMYLARTMTKKSFPEIGRRIGARDHAAVIHGVDRVSRALAGGLFPEVEELRREILAARA